MLPGKEVQQTKIGLNGAFQHTYRGHGTDRAIIGGLVEVPCVYRNVGAVGIAFTVVEMALSGIVCPIDPDEEIQAMKDVGGCAACPSIYSKLKR